MGPFILTDLLGLDTVLHVAEHLQESYGDRFYVHPGMQKLVAEGKLGAKTGGEGSYKDGEPNLDGDADPDVDELVEMFSLKALVEACLILEEGVCTVREIDLGMMAGAGLDPRRGLLPAVLEGRRRRASTSSSRSSRTSPRSTRTASRSRSPSSASSPRAASARRPARASTPTRSPTRASRPRRSSSRPATAASRSPGSPTCR